MGGGSVVVGTGFWFGTINSKNEERDMNAAAAAAADVCLLVHMLAHFADWAAGHPCPTAW